jgi:hypothetical protein
LPLSPSFSSLLVRRNCVRLGLGYSKHLILDMGFVLEGKDLSELPEILMGTCRFNHIDISVAQKL